MFESYYNQYKDQFCYTIQELDMDIIGRIMDEIEHARKEERRIFVVGNGGSAASASHWMCDFGKGTNVDGIKRIKMLSLTDNLPMVTALGNDIDFADIFLEQLKNLMHRGDVVIGLSVSGNSENIVRAFQYARSEGCIVISLVGNKMGRMKDLSDISLVIPSDNYGVVEDVHMFVNHVISQYLRTVYEQEAGIVAK